MEQIKQLISRAVSQLYQINNSKFDIDRPLPQFGDFTTNAAMKLAGDLGKNPREIANSIKDELLKEDSMIEHIDIAGPGFVNIVLHTSFYLDTIRAILSQKEKYGHNKVNQSKIILAEYSDPNPLKPLHAGHLYTTLIGDSIARLLEASGANVKRISYGGDVGLHVGKSMWAITQEIGEDFQKLNEVPVRNRASWLGQKYVAGNDADEENEKAKAQIKDINKRVYELHSTDDKQSPFAKIYWAVRQWSYDYFDELYKQLGVVSFDRTIPESEVVETGLRTVRANIPQVYKESDGAIIFKGEDFGLHTRVFINSQGLPTYETKDIGLLHIKWQDYKFDQSIVITANEQSQYMQVMLKSVEQFNPELAEKSKHLAHGVVKLAGGVKMSSRKGNILGATDILQSAKEANQKITGKDDDSAVLAAVKYSFLKQRIGGDIIYDPDESVNVLGNSGPYLQYAYVRAKSILAKADTTALVDVPSDIQGDEVKLLRKLDEFSEAVLLAVNELMPHHICSYLYELAQEFNRFYEKNNVLESQRKQQRLAILTAYVQVLGNGLDLLGINKPTKM